jgi:hypothetical protein
MYVKGKTKWGIFVYFFTYMYFIQHCFICRPSDSTVSEDAGNEPRSVATLQWQADALTTRLDLNHKKWMDENETLLWFRNPI